MSHFSFDPFESFKQMSLLMEKQMNETIKQSTNNKEFLAFTKTMNDFQMRCLEEFTNKQEMFYEQMNIPTKNDYQSLSSLTIQTEEKVDALEEQLWELQESIGSIQSDIEALTKVSKQLVTLNKQIKSEMTKLRKEQELAADLNEINELRAEIKSFKQEDKKEKQLVAVGESK